MPINPIKEFFQKRKAEVKFARAGPGKTLASTSGQSSATSGNDQTARQAAAEAAMKRFNKDNTRPTQRPRISSDQPTTQPPPNPQESTSSPPGEVVSSPLQKELPVVDGIVQRNVQYYSTDELAQRIKQPDIDDDFFRLTVDDAKLFQQRYEEERARNEILRTSEMRKREAEAKKPTTNVARLRFKLPTGMILEASFNGNERFSLVCDWLVSNSRDIFSLTLDNFDILFGLRPLKGSDFEKSVKDLGLLPATTLTVVQKTT